MRSAAAFCSLANMDFRNAALHFKRSPVDVRELLVLVPNLLPKTFSFAAKEEYNPLCKYHLDLEGTVKMALTRRHGCEQPPLPECTFAPGAPLAFCTQPRGKLPISDGVCRRQVRSGRISRRRSSRR